KICPWMILLAAFIGTGNPSSAQEVPAPRVFTKIEVEGNSRFRDQDVIATSGLQTGDAIGEPELIAAVEALEFTGEFEDIVISSNGQTLIITVEETPAFTGGLTFGLGFDTDDGIFGSVGLSIDNAFDRGLAIRSNLIVAEETQTFRTLFSSENFWGDGRRGGVRFDLENYDFENTAYDFFAGSIEPFITFDIAQNALLELRYTLSVREIYNVNPLASPIIQAENGQDISSGVGFSLLFGSQVDPNGLATASAWRLRFDQDFTGLGGDTAYSESKLILNARQRLTQSGFAIRTTVELGAVTALGGDDPRASERFTLGGSRLRGFERATISPRDVCLGCGPGGSDLITILGGNYFAVARTDLLVPIFQRQPQIETFAFFDIGSAWNVDSDVAPAGILEDSADFRSSYGIGASFSTGIGKFEAYYAIGTDGEPFDEDQEFGLSFRASF
ncbi:MAG: BamA/TamA family outer membrane protein, partial [Pseudomonadota bacterium]